MNEILLGIALTATLTLIGCSVWIRNLQDVSESRLKSIGIAAKDLESLHSALSRRDEAITDMNKRIAELRQEKQDLHTTIDMETKRLTDAANRNDKSYTTLLTMLQSISALVAKTKGELDINDSWYPFREYKQVVTSHAEAWNKAKEEVLAAGGRREGKTLVMAAGYGGNIWESAMQKTQAAAEKGMKPPSFMPEIPRKPLGPDMPMVGQKWVTKSGREAEVTLVELAVWVTGRHYGVEISRFWKMYKRVKKEDAPVITDDGWVKARNGALVRFQHPSRGWLFAWIVSMNPGAAVADIRYIDSTGAEVGAIHSLKGIVYVKDGDQVQKGPGNQGQDKQWSLTFGMAGTVVLGNRISSLKQMTYEFLCRYYKPVVEDFPAGVEVNPGIMQSDGYTSPMDQ